MAGFGGMRRSAFRPISSVVPTGNRTQIRHYSYTRPLCDTPERHRTFKHIWFFQPHKSDTKNQKSLNFSNAPIRNPPEPQKKSTNYFTKLKF